MCRRQMGDARASHRRRHSIPALWSGFWSRSYGCRRKTERSYPLFTTNCSPSSIRWVEAVAVACFTAVTSDCLQAATSLQSPRWSFCNSFSSGCSSEPAEISLYCVMVNRHHRASCHAYRFWFVPTMLRCFWLFLNSVCGRRSHQRHAWRDHNGAMPLMCLPFNRDWKSFFCRILV